MTTDVNDQGTELMGENQLSIIEQQTRGEIDIQISTARRYPRSIRKFLDNAKSLALVNEETAASCMYALQRKDSNGASKPIEGPSIRLAEIVASSWGHLRVQAQVVEEGERFVTVRGMAWDLERNVAVSAEQRRRITTRDGRRYGDDMINVTVNAAMAIALRNAIFHVIPRAHINALMEECKTVAKGTVASLEGKRAEVLKYIDAIKIAPERVYAALDAKGIEDMDLERMRLLKGIIVAISESVTTVDEAFPPIGSSQPGDAASAAEVAAKIGALAAEKRKERKAKESAIVGGRPVTEAEIKNEPAATPAPPAAGATTAAVEVSEKPKRSRKSKADAEPAAATPTPATPSAEPTFEDRLNALTGGAQLLVKQLRAAMEKDGVKPMQHAKLLEFHLKQEQYDLGDLEDAETRQLLRDMPIDWYDLALRAAKY